MNRHARGCWAASLALVATAACAGSGSHPKSSKEPAALTVLNDSVAKTTAAGSAKVSMDMRFLTVVQSLHMTGNGVADLVHNKMDVVVQLPPGSGVAGSAEELQLGPVLYFKLPPAVRWKSKGKAWVVMDPTQGGSLGQDPNAYLKAMSHAVTNISEQGRETVRGVATTHFHGDLDLQKTASAQMAAMGKAMGLSSYPMDYYVDDQRRLRRITMVIVPKAGSQAAASVVSESVTEDFYAFGSADTSKLVAPPKDQTIDINDAPDFASSGILG